VTQYNSEQIRCAGFTPYPWNHRHHYVGEQASVGANRAITGRAPRPSLHTLRDQSISLSESNWPYTMRCACGWRTGLVPSSLHWTKSWPPPAHARGTASSLWPG